MAIRRQFGLIIVGGGPAGIAVLLAAHKNGRLTEMLKHGVLIVERSAHIGAGQIGEYAINSDSTGTTFIAPLIASTDPSLRRILETRVAQRIAAAGMNAVPLRDAGELLGLIGNALQVIVESHPCSAILTGFTADSARRQPNGRWLLAATGKHGAQISFEAKHLVLATGADQPKTRLKDEFIAGEPLLQRWGDRLIQSSNVIGRRGLVDVGKRLEKIPEPKVAILGGSTSAMSVAHSLLHRLPNVRFGEGGVTLFHRRPLRVYYYTPEEALADGYTEFGPEDICPVTNRVYRLAGVRLDSRELLMQLRGIGGRAPEPRLRAHQLKQSDPEAVYMIDSAHLVVAAFGYRPNALRLHDEYGSDIRLFAETTSDAPLVDHGCRVLDHMGSPIPGVFGIGLAAGFVPHGKLGGEPSFKGQANGLWLWQNDVGMIVVNGVLQSTAPGGQSQPSAAPLRAVNATRNQPIALRAKIGGQPFRSLF